MIILRCQSLLGGVGFYWLLIMVSAGFMCSKARSENYKKSIIPPGLPYINPYLEDCFRWPNNTFYYRNENANVTELASIRAVMDFLESVTCVVFEDISQQPEEWRNYHFVIRIIREPVLSCVAFLGYRCYPTKYRIVRLSENCVKQVGSTSHELMHTMGILHQHSRPDRDNYVTILTKNIMPLFVLNFITLYFTLTFGVPYDYCSVMHYGAYAFSIDRQTKKTIVTKDPAYQNVIGNYRYQDELASFHDLWLINVALKCSAHCPKAWICPDGCFMSKHCLCYCPEDVGPGECNRYTFGETPRMVAPIPRPPCKEKCTFTEEEETNTYTFQTPCYPYYYTTNTLCVHTTNGDKDIRYKITWKTFDLQPDPYCGDYILVKSKHCLAQRMCKSESTTMIVGGRYTKIGFYSDKVDESEGSGVRAVITTLNTTQCQQKVQISYLPIVVSSSGLTEESGDEKDCEWIVENNNPVMKRIKLKFLELHFPHSCNDYLLLDDTNNYCKQQKICSVKQSDTVITSISNYMYILLHVQQSHRYSSFSAIIQPTL